MIQDVKCLFGSVMDKLRLDIIKELQGAGYLSDDQLRSIDTLFNAAANPFQGLETAYLQDKYFKEHLNYLVRILCCTIVHVYC